MYSACGPTFKYWQGDSAGAGKLASDTTDPVAVGCAFHHQPDAPIPANRTTTTSQGTPRRSAAGWAGKVGSGASAWGADLGSAARALSTSRRWAFFARPDMVHLRTGGRDRCRLWPRAASFFAEMR